MKSSKSKGSSSSSRESKSRSMTDNQVKRNIYHVHKKLLHLFFKIVIFFMAFNDLFLYDNDTTSKRTEHHFSLRNETLASVSMKRVLSSPSKQMSSHQNNEIHDILPTDSSVTLLVDRNHQKIVQKTIESTSQIKQKTDILLVTTIDGALHGVDRVSGLILWSLTDLWGPSVQSRAITKQYPNSMNEDKEEENLKPKFNQHSNLNLDIQKEGIYIPEPVGEGNLYHYVPGQTIKKLPLSLKKIVQEKPVHVSKGHIYTAKKISRLAAINPFNGKILRTFGDEYSEGFQDAHVDGWGVDPNHIFIGRTDYVLVIQDTKTSSTKWNITYGEYTVSNPGDYHFQSKDDPIDQGEVSISIGHGGLLNYEEKEGRGEFLWKKKLSSLPNNVFQVMRTSDFEHPFFLKKLFPVLQNMKERANSKQNLRNDEAYLGEIFGNFYIMSKKNFPSLFSSDEKLFIENEPLINQEEKGLSLVCTVHSPHFPSCLTGSHLIERFPIDEFEIESSSLPAGYIDAAPYSPSSTKWYLLSGLVWIILTVFSVTTLLFKLSSSAGEVNLQEDRKRNNSTTKAVNTEQDIYVTEGSLNMIGERSIEAEDDLNQRNRQTTNFKKIVDEFTSDSKEHEGLKSLIVSDEVLGYGSHGTIVYKGIFEGREVAVKRLLLDFYDVAHHEVNALQDSDHHPSVVRYYIKEQTERFMYIALELCPASLYDMIEKPLTESLVLLKVHMKPKKIMFSIMQGIHHLHSLKIVHRDIKPQNILIAPSKNKSNPHPRILISDFGLCKRLSDDQSSFHNTIGAAGGTIGWRAPECMVTGPTTNPKDISETSFSESTSDDKKALNQASSSPDHSLMGSHPNGDLIQRVKITKKIDIFSAGCLFYYVLSNGEHPFGERFSREINILKGNFRLDKLDLQDEEGNEARDLIRKMIAKDPKKRPNSGEVLVHPYFWTIEKRLNFLQDVSDRFEIEERDPPSSLSKQLERNSNRVIGGDWQRKIDKRIMDNLLKFRKYDPTLIRDLLRAIRNKKHHYQDLSEPVKNILGSATEGLLSYFTSKFPHLFLHVHHVVASNESLKKESMFENYFKVPETI